MQTGQSCWTTRDDWCHAKAWSCLPFQQWNKENIAKYSQQYGHIKGEEEFICYGPCFQVVKAAWI